MGINSLSRDAVLSGFLSGLAIAIGSLPGAAIDLSGRFLLGETTKQLNPQSIQIAQAGDPNCRQTNAVAAVYQQPDPISVSQGVLPAGQNVRLEVVGTGTGWSRIREPIVGWVEARYLTPPTPCAYSASAPTARSTQASAAPVQATPVAQASVNPTQLPQVNPGQSVAARPPINTATPSNFPQPDLPTGQSQVTVPPLSAAAPQTFPQPIQSNSRPNNVAVRPTVPPLPAIVPQPQPVSTERAIVATVCDVLPREGLTVRQQPNPNSAGVSIIPAGTYNFQFTGATQTVGRQRLAYIVAPTEGWIQVLSQNGVSTLGGGRCG